MLVTLEVKGFNVTCQMTLSMKRHHEPQVKNVFELLSMYLLTVLTISALASPFSFFFVLQTLE